MEVLDQKTNRYTSVGDWVLNIFLIGLPVIGLILLFVWAFGDGQREDRKNWSKAMLIWYLITIGIVVIFGVIFGGIAALTAVMD